MSIIFSHALASAATVGLGCGAGCGSSASAFLTTYVLSEGKNLRYALSQVAVFYLGKLLAVAAVCTCGAAFGQAFFDANGNLGGFPLKKLVSVVMIAAALWLICGWLRERKGCGACRHCAGKSRRAPSFAVGMAYGFSPCAPLLLVLGYAVLLPVPAALGLGIVFSLCSSIIPAVLTLILSGALSLRIAGQLGKALPWFQIVVYVLYLLSGVSGLLA